VTAFGGTLLVLGGMCVKYRKIDSFLYEITHFFSQASTVVPPSGANCMPQQ
jgi:hypothetical protein